MKKLLTLISIFLTLPLISFAHGNTGIGADESYMHMMDWHMSGTGGMMGGGFWGILGFLTWIVWLTVGILLIAVLWQKINKK